MEEPTLSRPDLKHLDFVDALRGLAILGVILVHATQGVTELKPILMTVAGRGAFGVQLFFVVSSFTIFLSLIRKAGVDRRPLLAFFTRRFFRVAPLFWIAAFAYLGTVDSRRYYAPNGIGAGEFLSTLLFVHGWYPTSINSVVPGGWSIAAEAMFYLLVPILFLYVRSFSRAVWLIAGASLVIALGSGQASAVIGRLLPHLPADLISAFVYFSFPSQLPVFLTGIALFHAVVAPDRIFTGPGVSGVIAVAILIWMGLVPAHIICAFAFGGMAYALWHRSPTWIVNRPMKFLGTISYSVYIWHFAVVDLLVGHMPRFGSGTFATTLQFCAFGAAVLLVTVPLAALSYVVVERVGIMTGRWLIQTRGWGPAAKVSTPQLVTV